MATAQPVAPPPDDVTLNYTASGTLQEKDNGTTNAKLAQMAALTFKGNNTGSTANAADLTVTQAAAMLQQFAERCWFRI